MNLILAQGGGDNKVSGKSTVTSRVRALRKQKAHGDSKKYYKAKLLYSNHAELRGKTNL